MLSACKRVWNMSPIACRKSSSLQTQIPAEIITHRHVNVHTHSQPWTLALLHPSVVVNFLLGWFSTGRQEAEMEGAEPRHAVWEKEEEEEEEKEETIWFQTSGSPPTSPNLSATQKGPMLRFANGSLMVANQSLCGRDKRNDVGRMWQVQTHWELRCLQMELGQTFANVWCLLNSASSASVHDVPVSVYGCRWARGWGSVMNN